MNDVKNENLFRRFIQAMTRVEIETAGCIYSFVDDLEFQFICLEDHYGESFDSERMYDYIERYRCDLEKEVEY